MRANPRGYRHSSVNPVHRKSYLDYADSDDYGFPNIHNSRTPLKLKGILKTPHK